MECQNLHIPDSRKQPLTSRTNKLTGLSKGVPLTDHLLIISSNTHMCGSPGQPAFILKRAATLQLLAGTLQGLLQVGVVANDGDLDGARGHRVLPYGGGVKVRMVLVVMACLLLATACGSSEPELDMSQAAIAERVEAFVKTPAATTAVPTHWLEHYPWSMKAQVDQWITNCEDIQTHFDVVYEAREGYKRRFGHSGTEIMEYLHQIGKRMGCEDFQW